jgi:hypothetical protein
METVARSAFVLAALLFSAPVNALLPLDPKESAILPPDRAKDLVHQCSRGAPGPVEGTWLPDKTQVRELEARLPEALDSALAKRGEKEHRPRDFLRQYGGFIIHGHKIIYMNAFPRSLIDDEERFNEHNEHKRSWHRDVEGVCDGGPSFFGVEYDPKTKTFSHFEFNGIA